MRNREKIQDAELEARYEKYKNVIQNITLMSDIFMRNVFKQRKCLEYVLQVIMERQELYVIEHVIQKDYKNLQGRSAIMRRRKVKSGSTAFLWNRSALRSCIRGLRFWSRTPICLMQRLPRILPLQSRMLPKKKSEQRQSVPVSRSLSRRCRRAIRPIWVR